MIAPDDPSFLRYVVEPDLARRRHVSEQWRLRRRLRREQRAARRT